jgi:hypothetical protein
MKLEIFTVILLFCVAGIYFGRPRGFGTNDNGEETGFNTEIYSVSEVTAVFIRCFNHPLITIS